MNRFGNQQHGFTLIEMVIVIGVISILLGIISISIFSISNSTSLSSTVQKLSGDIKEQQLKAMVGDTESRSTADTYGIHFDTSRYTLFHGSTYNAADSTNFDIDLPPNQTFIISLPSNSVVFSQLSGEVTGFISGQDSITIQDEAGAQKTLHFNAYGTITQVD